MSRFAGHRLFSRNLADTQEIVAIFFVVFSLCLSVAIINGFPLYMSDSHSYVGSLDYISTLRSPVPGLVAVPLYPWIGAWALPVIASATIAFLFVQFCEVVIGTRPNLLSLLVLFPAAAVPISASFILADAWLLIEVMGVIILLHRWRTIECVIVAIAIAGHGANFLIMLLLSPLILLIWPSLRRAILVVGVSLCASSLTLAVGNLIIDGKPFAETFGWSIVASKMMNDIPETVDDLCNAGSHHPLCDKRGLMGDNPDRYDEYYIWFSKISWPETGGLTRTEFNDLGKMLFWDALQRHPLQFALATASDWLDGYDSDRCFPVGYLEKDDSNEYTHFLIDQDHGVFAHHDWLVSPVVCKSIYLVNMLLMGAALGLGIVFYRMFSPAAKASLLIMWFAILANDFVFASLSGIGARHTVRAYGLLVLIVLLSLQARQRVQNEGGLSPTKAPSVD